MSDDDGSPAAARPLRILHLEDDPADAELVAERLRADGFAAEIVQVATGADFEASLARGEVDLVLSDYRLPGFSGLEALELVRRRRPEVPVIFCTGTLGDEAAIETMRRGAVDYVLKDRLSALTPAIERALGAAREHRGRLVAEAALAASEQRFRLLAETSEDGFWFWDEGERRVVYVNPAVEQIFGHPASAFYARPRLWLEAVDDADRGRIEYAWRRFLAGETPRLEEEFGILRGDGAPRDVVVSGAPTRRAGAADQLFGGLVRDVTERREAERRAARAQRLESIGTLAGGIAHDLNNTLAPILIAAELLASECPPAGQEYLSLIEGGARRGARMVRQLLAFARGVEGERRELAATELVDEVAQLVRTTFPKSISLHVAKARERLPKLVGDRTQLHQALLNLCVNARDAMAAGGELRIELAEVAADRDGAWPDREQRAGGWLRLRVRDSGDGIPAELQERVFEPFFTTKAPERGTGLGLSSTLGIVESHGGFLRLASRPGEGTTVDLYLPAVGSGAIPAPGNEAEPPVAAAGELVLVVDDEAMIRQMLRALLERLGYRPLVASGGAEALELVEEHGAAVRCVLCDLQMPGLDGIALLRALAAKLPSTRLVAMSGVFEPEQVAALRAAGVQHRLEKPFDGGNLATALSSA